MVSYTRVKFTRCELCEQKLKLHSDGTNTIGAMGLKFCMDITNGVYLLFANDGVSLEEILENFDEMGYFNGYQNFKWL